MAIKHAQDLPPQHSAAWLQAGSAFQFRNYSYALQLLHGILQEHPEFLAGRQLARKVAAQQRKIQQRGWRRIFRIPFFFISFFRLRRSMKRDSWAALGEIEKFLETDPSHPQANELLYEAARACEMPETAAFALETLLTAHPQNTKILHVLAQHFLHYNQPHRAMEIYRHILEIAPQDLAAVKGGKDAAALASLQKGGWEREEESPCEHRI